MKIKQKKQVNLPQLIEWAWKNEITDIFSSSDQLNIVVEICNGMIITDYGSHYPTSSTRFEIEEEVEIDENTVFDRLLYINGIGDAYIKDNFSINNRLHSSLHIDVGTKFIYLQNEDGSIGDLIWANGKMVE